MKHLRKLASATLVNATPKSNRTWGKQLAYSLQSIL